MDGLAVFVGEVPEPLVDLAAANFELNSKLLHFRDRRFDFVVFDPKVGQSQLLFL